ncbi:MAG TPA: hypothetical protein DCM60_08055 [Nitrospina sp.]|nr:hypothetical protein [Nitrospina sp.]
MNFGSVTFFLERISKDHFHREPIGVAFGYLQSIILMCFYVCSPVIPLNTYP